MDKRLVSLLVGRMRSWCVEFLEVGPFWGRGDAMSVIEACDSFSLEIENDIYDDFDDFGDRLERRVVRLCVKSGRRAPPGWHFRLMRDESYRSWFRRPRKDLEK